MNTEKEKRIYHDLNINPNTVKDWAATKYPVNMQTVYKMQEEIKKADIIKILGDYDCDGVCASWIAKRSIESLYPDKRVDVLIPTRGEGYGVNQRQINDAIKDSKDNNVLVITVDNGITAKGLLSQLNDNDIPYIVTDHHEFKLPEELPDANLVIDPAVKFLPNPLTGRYYCGASTVFKLFEPVLSKDVRDELLCYAALANVADCITMRKECWALTREGIKLFREGKSPQALNQLLMLMKQDPLALAEDTFGFYLGPAFNAPGRLYHEGPIWVIDYLSNPTQEKAERIVAINEERKMVRDNEYSIIQEIIERENKANREPLWIYVPNLHEGIVGILAGKIVEDYKTSAIVLTDAEEPGIYKGSARSYGNFNMYEYLFEHRELLVKFGGHPGAAGLSLTPKQYEQIKDFTDNLQELEEVDNSIDIREDEIPNVSDFIEPLRPFGLGYEEPLFNVEVNLAKDPFRMLGEEKNHLAIQNDSPKYKIMHFFHTPNNLNNKSQFKAIGKVTDSIFKGYHTPQFLVDKIEDIDELDRD